MRQTSRSTAAATFAVHDNRAVNAQFIRFDDVLDLWEAANALELTSHAYEGDMFDGEGFARDVA